jgi:hypothetical protein
LSNPIAIGGIIGGVGAVVGVTVYFVFFAGSGGAAGAVGSSAGSSGSGVSGSGGGDGSGGGSGSNSGGSIIQPISDGSGPLVSNHPIGELAMNTTPINPSPINNSPGMQQQPATQPEKPVNDSIVNQMMQDNQQQQMDRWKIMHDTYTKPFETMQDVTVNKQKTQDKSFQTWDQFLRSSNDPDAVADSGSGSGGSEA